MRLDGERRKGYTFVDRTKERRTRRRRRGAIVFVAVALATVAGVIQLASAASDPPSTYAGATLTAKQTMEYAYAAGFHTQQQLVTVTAIGIAESGLVTKTRNWHPEFGYRPASDVIDVQGPASVWSGNRQMNSDRGLWQISSHFWPQYTDAQTDNPATAAKLMWAISKHGTDFTPWNTFTGGQASRDSSSLGGVAQAVIAAGGGTPAPQPAPQPSKPAVKPAAKPPAKPASSTGSELRMAGSYLTAYSYYDNNPPGSAAISHPVIHRQAGGKGTFANPITVAVANGSNGGLQFAPGTKFYVPNLRAYFIAEDTIGGASGSRVHLDLWAGGQSSSRSAADRCMSHVTGNYLVIRNPARNYAVVSGPLSANDRCRKLYGDTVRISGASAPAHAPTPPSKPPTQPSTPPTDNGPSGSTGGTDSGSQHDGYQHHHRDHAQWSSSTICRH
jgi:hypothetical protein